MSGNTEIPLSKLKPGERGLIVSLENSNLGLKLMEMGCLPGEEILLKKVAPLGDPISIQIGSYLLSLRKSEAAAVLVHKILEVAKSK